MKRTVLGNEELNEKTIVIIAIILYIISAIIAIVVKRSFYADGTNFFFWLVNKNMVIADDPNVLRIGINFLNQLLVIGAIKLGVSNIYVLSILYSIPLFFVSVIGLILCYKLADDKMLVLFPVAYFSCFGIVSEIFSSNPGLNAAWIYWILFFLLIKETKITRNALLPVILCIIILPISHETAIPISLLFCLICIDEIFVRKKKKNIVLKSCIFVSSISSIFGGFWFMHSHVNSTGSIYFSQFLDNLTWNNIIKSNLSFSIIGIIIIVLSLFFRLPRQVYYLIMGVGIIHVIICFAFNFTSPLFEYNCRSLVTIGTFGTMTIAYIYVIKLEQILNRNCLKQVIIAVSIVLSLQCFWQIGNSINWSLYLQEFDALLSKENGILDFDQYFYNKYSWVWTNTELSILECENQKVKLLLMPSDGFEVFRNEVGVYIPYAYVNENIFDLSDVKCYLEYRP